MRIETFSWVLLAFTAACASAPTTPSQSSPLEGAPQTGGPERPKLTQAQCEAQGGGVVGDIGDGATHRPDYMCPSGKPPLGNVMPPEGGPIAVEGSVCCPR